MNKAELINAIAAKSGMSKKDVELAVASTFEVITESLKAGEEVALVGFGKFSVKERAAHTGKNPATGETIEIAACKVPGFSAGKALKDAIQ
jgi:DNA-binding protein HU-beta